MTMKKQFNCTDASNIENFNIEDGLIYLYSDEGWLDELKYESYSEFYSPDTSVPLTYDENGNVLTFGSKSFTWSSGRNLATYTDDNYNCSYTYDENGIRTSKTVNGVTTYYNTKDGVILSQTDGTNTMYFQYDNNGTPIGFIYNNIQYFYITNQSGDVVAITYEDGSVFALYNYDAWGKILSIDTA